MFNGNGGIETHSNLSFFACAVRFEVHGVRTTSHRRDDHLQIRNPRNVNIA